MGVLVNPYIYAGFTPTDIPNLELWLDATDATTLTLSGSSVTQWDDKSGSSHDMSQATAASQPAYVASGIDSQPSIQFADGDYLSRADALGLTGNPNITIVAVSRILSTPTRTAMNIDLYLGDLLGAVGECAFFQSDSNGYAHRFNNGNQIFNTVQTLQNDILLYERVGGETYGQGSFYFNGGSEEGMTSNANATFTPNLRDELTLIGGRIEAVGGTVDSANDRLLSELLVYNRVLSNTEKNSLGAYLANKYSASWTDIFTIGLATASMTLDATWDNTATNYSDLVSATTASCKVVATFNSSDTGIIMEAGASGIGCVLYIFDGILYYQSGNGGAFGEDADTRECQWAVPNLTDETYTIEWSSTTTAAALYIDGYVVDISTNATATSIAGGDTGGIDGVHGAGVAVNRGGWTAVGTGTFTGTISDCDIFVGEKTSDI